MRLVAELISCQVLLSCCSVNECKSNNASGEYDTSLDAVSKSGCGNTFRCTVGYVCMEMRVASHSQTLTGDEIQPATVSH